MTHLPQIAAHADAQFRITKRERDGRTVTEVERLDREGRIVELAHMLGSGDGAAAGSPPPASSSTAPRRGAAGSRRPADADGPDPRPSGARSSTGRSTTTWPTSRSSAACRRATIRAYRGDLHDFAAQPRRRPPLVALAGGRRSATSRRAPAAAARATRASPRRACAAASASLKGFYRFAYGEGLIDQDIAAHLDLPKQTRLLPETLTVEETERLLEAAGGDDPDAPEHDRQLRDRALLELLYAAGLRISEALRLDAEDLSIDGGFVRVIGKGDKERLVPVGDVALDWLARWMAGPRVRLLALHHVDADARRARCSSAIAAAGSRASRPGRRSSRRRPRRRTRRPRQPAHAAPLVRDASARGRRGPAHRPGVARTCEYLHDPALHAPDRRADPGRLQSGPSAGLKRRLAPMSFADTLLSTGERIVHREKQHWFVFVWGARFTILAIVVAVILLFLSNGLSTDGITGRPPVRHRLGRRRDLRRRPGRPRLDDAPLPQPGVRHHQPARHAGRRRPQQALGRQLAREDQRRGPDPVDLRADVRTSATSTS